MYKSVMKSAKKRISKSLLKSVKKEVEVFANKHKHFARLAPLMGKMLSADLATGLKDAYQKAKYIDCQIRDGAK